LLGSASGDETGRWMAGGRLRVGLVATALVAAACGGGTETTATSAGATTTGGSTTTTTSAPAASPLDPLVSMPVEDALLGSGFNEMEWGNDVHTVLFTPAPVDGPGGSGVLTLMPLAVEPPTTGIGDDQMLLMAAVLDYSGDIAPAGIVLYTLAGSVWEATIPIVSYDILAVLEGTTDYAAVAPASPVVVGGLLVSFDWSGTVATFTIDVVVQLPTTPDPVYSGQLECTHDGTTLDCGTLSDDGVLRQGDEGDAVEALQQALTDLGYLEGPIDGKYGPGTESAVRSFQTDFWLTVDGRAGPNTLSLIDDLLSGVSDLILINDEGIGEIEFTTLQNAVIRETANPNIYQGALVNLLGQPDDYDTYVSGCDAASWVEASWGAFTAILTTRDGPMQLDGWKITDLGNLDSRFRIGGGIRPTWRWSAFEAAGAGYDPTYGEFFYMFDLNYNNGRFVEMQGANPSAAAVIRGFGTGTGAFVSC
jgi:hypothetical protein